MKPNAITEKLLMGLMLAAGLNASANATMITLQMQGAVDGFHSSLSGPGGFSVGTPMTGSMTFDNSVADTDISALTGSYPGAITAWTYNIGTGPGARTYTSTGSSYQLGVADLGLFSEDIFVSDLLGSSDPSIGGPSVNGFSPSLLNILLSGPDTVLSSDALPGASFDFSGFTNRQWFVAFDIGTGNVTVSGTLSSITATVAAVPEPETYALMLAGLGLIGFISRRKAGFSIFV